MRKIEIDNFYNDGFGWICKHCERASHDDSDKTEVSRLLNEGEAEAKKPEMSSKALAKWLDAAQTILTCPNCGVSEKADKF